MFVFLRAIRPRLIRKLHDPGDSLTNSRDISEAPMDDREEGEEMDATNEDDAAMMAMMGMSGFGTTKVNSII